MPPETPLNHFGHALTRLPAGPKFGLLFAVSLIVFCADNAPLLAVLAAAAPLLTLAAGTEAKSAWRRYAPAALLAALLALFQYFSLSAGQALAAGLRLFAVLAFAGFISAITPASAMIAAFERGFIWLRPLGVKPRRAALTLALALRFMPLLGQIYQQLRTAQALRGAAKFSLKHQAQLLSLTLIQLLACQEQIAEAIAARGGEQQLTRRASSAPKEQQIMPIKSLCLVALFAAFIAVLGLAPPLFLPIFPLIPLSLHSLGPMLAGALLGAKRGFYAVALFWLLLAAGLAFAGGSSGPAAFAGPMGGYIIGFGAAALIIGALYDRFPRANMAARALFLSLGGIVAVYACGIGWLMLLTHLRLSQALALNAAFLPGDCLKIALCLMAQSALAKAQIDLR